MNERDLKEQDVIRLLERWKQQETVYPSGMQEKQRAAFLALGATLVPAYGGPTGAAGQPLAQAVHAAQVPMTLGMKVVLGFLSTVILGLSTYLGVTVYENREAIINYLRGEIPTLIQETLAPLSTASPWPTPTYLPSPTATPTPTLFPSAIPSATDENGNIIIQGTPTLNPASTPTNPGWHYGQTKTPKPKRTNEP